MSTFDVSARPITEAHRREHKRNVVLLLAAAVALALFLLLRITARGHTADEARVEGHVVGVAPAVVGVVQRVLVKNNQAVEAGQPLVELAQAGLETQRDLAEAERAGAGAALTAAQAQLALTERSARASLAQARGGVLQAGYGLSASNAARKQAESELRMARERQRRMESEHARALDGLREAGTLDPSGALPQVASAEWAQTLESARANVARAEALVAGSAAHSSTSWGNIVAARGRLDAARGIGEQLEIARSNVGLAEAKLAETDARLSLAKQAMDAAVIRAPVAGTVTRVSAEVGQTTDLAKPLLAIISDDECWVSATFAERQLGKLKPGQGADVHVAALGDRPLKATIESLSGAGPVLLRLNDKAEARALRPGMSAAVSVSE